MEDVEIIKDNEEILAIIIRKDFKAEGIKFFTPDDFSQQLAYMRHPKGKKIKPHIHNAVKREVHFTQEVLLIKSGKLKTNIFRNDKSFLSTHILGAGNVILLAGGGHSFEGLEDFEMIEIKQGPYVGERDKTRFEAKKTEDRRQRTEDGGQRTEDRGQRTEDRGQRTEDGGQRAEDRSQR